jgi:transcriptional regulator with XRE-family HTH domain
MLADHADLTREHLSELESGKKEAGLRTIQKLADALGVSPSSLL